jgi:hypothetical protein
MKTNQKLELYAGLATQTVLLFYLFLSLLIVGISTNESYKSLLEIVFVAWLFSLLIAFGAYAHSKKQSLFAFTTLFIGVILFVLIWGALTLLCLYFVKVRGIIYPILALIPLTLSILTIIFAVSSLPSNKENI